MKKYINKREFFTLNGFYLGEFNELEKEDFNDNAYHKIFDRLSRYAYDYDLYHFTKLECKEISYNLKDVLFDNELSINIFGKMVEDYYYYNNNTLYDDLNNRYYPNLYIPMCDQYCNIIRNENVNECADRIYKYYGYILKLYDKKISFYKKIYRKVIKIINDFRKYIKFRF